MPSLPKNKRPTYIPEPPARTGGSNQDFYNHPTWRGLRLRQLERQPLCEAHLLMGETVDCMFGGIVDHIVRIEAGGAAYDMDNLQTLCKPCHDIKSALESHGLTIPAIGEHGQRIPTQDGKRISLEAIKQRIA